MKSFSVLLQQIAYAADGLLIGGRRLGQASGAAAFSLALWILGYLVVGRFGVVVLLFLFYFSSSLIGCCFPETAEEIPLFCIVPHCRGIALSLAASHCQFFSLSSGWVAGESPTNTMSMRRIFPRGWHNCFACAIWRTCI